MTEQDQARIAAIEDYLTELTKMYGKQFKPIAPVEPNTIAKTVEPIKEDRWKPACGCKYWVVNISEYGTGICPEYRWGNDRVDYMFYSLYNIFPTEEAAQIAADKIKQLLTTL